MTLVPFIHGAVAMGAALVGVFFLRFWKQAHDRLFLFFALAFFILGADYVMLGLLSYATEWRIPVFTVRLCAFLIILIGIADKNRR
ncbi:MAG: hypothetical protein JSU08_17840 [Acidobacteria bacterium]|nr:hypothetical protein [Acidobacteriota bacterium]